MIDLLDKDIIIKVSSTLDKSVGKRNLVDRNPESCWTSQENLPQHIQIQFPNKVVPQKIGLTFQGGFVGTRCAMQVPAEGGWKDWTRIYPEDVNRQQWFELSDQPPEGFGALRLLFEQSSDFFGRITMYDIQLLGTKLD